MIKKYRKKPVVIEAMQYTIKHYKDLKDWAGDNVTMQLNSETTYQVIDNIAYPIINPIIHTLEGDMKVDNGDYVIKGVNGEFYPCKPDIFDKTYEEVEKSEPFCPYTPAYCDATDFISCKDCEILKEQRHD